MDYLGPNCGNRGIMCAGRRGLSFPSPLNAANSARSYGSTMHELPITESILEIAQRHGMQAGATRISDIFLVIGQLSG